MSDTPVGYSENQSGTTLANLLTNQVSSDQLISSQDMETVHEIIIEGREEDDRMSEYSYESDLLDGQNGAETFSLWNLLRKGAINFVLPFINGIMLGFGEILAHEIGFKYGFIGARVYPQRRLENKQSQERSKFL